MTDSSLSRRAVGRWGLGPISPLYDWINRKNLRILAYHGVIDARMFEKQLDFIAERYIPVSGSEVLQAVSLGNDLPDRSVWVTFDDGYRSVVDNVGLLNDRRITATLFVCPGIIEKGEAPWFDIVNEAMRNPLSSALIPGDPAVSHMDRLKKLPDSERRNIVSALAETLSNEQTRDLANQLAGESDLAKWRSLGHEIGNHSWDHPMLPMLDNNQVNFQIQSAKEWLAARSLCSQPLLFAFPNGDSDSRVLHAVRRQGYSWPLLFDHRHAKLSLRPNSLSRLRVSSDATVARLNAILSGAHGAILRARTSTQRVIRPRRIIHTEAKS